MKNEPQKSSGIPVVIIILVLVGVVVAGWYFYNSRGPAANGARTPTPGATPTRAAATPNPNAPQGATPPNLLGPQTSSVTLEEFADFQCSACASAHPVVKEIKSVYGDKMRLIFRNYPLPNHDKSYDAAVAAEAAGLQGKFWAMQDQLFSNQQSWSTAPNYRELWTGYAEKIGLDIQRWQSDVSGIAAKSRVDQDISRAKALGVSSTPTVLINGQSIPFSEVNVPALRRIIDVELQKAAGQQASAPVAPPAGANPSPAANAANKEKK